MIIILFYNYNQIIIQVLRKTSIGLVSDGQIIVVVIIYIRTHIYNQSYI